MDDPRPVSSFPRRTFLAGSVAVIAAACSGSGDGETTATTGAVSDSSPATTGQSAGVAIEALTPASFESVPICAMTPAQPAGPFPTLEPLDRLDITEGYPGHPFRLGIRVVDPACQPVAGARVEIWHADATGDYSSYEDNGSGKDEGEGTTFCRGFQTADADGIVEFQTIYPGWYEGRAVHIHIRADIDTQQLVTSQLYFDEGYTETVHATGEYAQFGQPDTGWADDPIVGDPATDGTGILLAAAPTSLGDGTLGLINLGVDV